MMVCEYQIFGNGFIFYHLIAAPVGSDEEIRNG